MRTPAARTLTDYGTVARRSWWLIVGVALAALVAGAAYTAGSDPVYESSASVLVLPTETDTSVVGARTAGQVNLDTEAQLVKSTGVASAAAEALQAPSTADLVSRVSVTVPPNTAVLQISFRAGSPEAAKAGTTAFSEAYLAHRRNDATDAIDASIEAKHQRLAALQSEVSAVESQLDALGPDGEGRRSVEAGLDALAGQVAALEGEVATLEASLGAVTPGRVINQPSLPSAPIAPNAMLNLAASLGVGLPLGFALAWARHRMARRIGHPTDLVERCEVDVLGTVPKSVRFQRREVFGAYTPGGRVFSQLRNVIASQLTDDQRVIVVAGVAPGPAGTVVAANLATAMARAGDRATVVAANPTTTVGLPELFGTDSVPGLADVWSRRIDLAATVRSAPRQPSLSVIGPGAAARATGPTSEAAAETFTKLAEAGRFVVVDAPPLSCSADAQLLAGHADAVILAIQAGRDTVAETAAAATAMRQIETPMVGAVLLPSSLGPMHNAPMPGSRREDPPSRRRVEDIPADETPTDALDAVGSGDDTPTSQFAKAADDR